MVFKLKQPPREPRPRVSAREVAKDLSVPPEMVMAALADLGEYVQSSASKLEEPVIRRLYEAMGNQYEPEKPKSPPAWERKGRTDQSPATAKLTRGVDEGDQTNWHSASRDDWWETQGDVAPAWELESWKLHGFTEAERDAWIAHGLRPGQVKDAAAYRDAGLIPPDLMKDAAGWTALKRLRAGERPIEVVRLLQALREDDRAG
jgi:hypothetical protein